MRNYEPVRQIDGHIPVLSVFDQNAVDKTHVGRRNRNFNMAIRQKLLGGYRATGKRVGTTHGTDHAIGYKRLGVDSGVVRQGEANRQIQLVTLEHIHGRFRREVHHVE